MSRNLHTGRVYQIEYAYPGLCGCEGQDALYDVFSMFEIENDAEDCYTDDYEVAREDLKKLRKILTDKSDIYKANEDEFAKCLTKMEKTHDEFLDVLNNLINDSDQNNEYVLISWF